MYSEEGRRQLAKIKELHLVADRLGCTAAQLAIGECFSAQPHFWLLVQMVWFTFKLILAKNHPLICAELCKISCVILKHARLRKCLPFLYDMHQTVIERPVHSNVSMFLIKKSACLQ